MLKNKPSQLTEAAFIAEIAGNPRFRDFCEPAEIIDSPYAHLFMPPMRIYYRWAQGESGYHVVDWITFNKLFLRYCAFNGYAQWEEFNAIPLRMWRLFKHWRSLVAEDHARCMLNDALVIGNLGIVTQDPIADMQNGIDLMVHVNGKTVLVSCINGDESKRPLLEASHARSVRRQWSNAHEQQCQRIHMHTHFPVITLHRNAQKTRIVESVHLFSIEAINDALKQIYTVTNVERGYLYPSHNNDRAHHQRLRLSNLRHEIPLTYRHPHFAPTAFGQRFHATAD